MPTTVLVSTHSPLTSFARYRKVPYPAAATLHLGVCLRVHLARKHSAPDMLRRVTCCLHSVSRL